MAGFGGAIKLTGESEYRKALASINQSLKEVSSEMKVVASAYDKNDNSTQALADKQNVLSKKLEEQVAKLDILKNRYNEMEATYGKNSQAQQELTKKLEEEKAKLTEIGNTLGTTSKEYQDQQKVVNDLENKQNSYNKAVSDAKIEMNKAQTEVNKTTKELDSLGKEEEDTTKSTKKMNEGWTVTKQVLADLSTKAIAGALNGLKSLGSAVINVGKQAITSYADYEQLVGGVETLFGAGGKSVEEYAQSVGKSVDQVQGEYDNLMKAQENVIKYSNDAYKTAGLSANEYMETVTSFSASLVNSLGGDTLKASEYSNRAIIDMSDNANKMGTDIGMLQNAYQGFAKQNYTMLDNLKLGYGGTKTEMQRLIKDASQLTDVQKELGITVDANDMSFGNIVNAISVVQSKMGIMGTTSKEASTTISGSVNSMKASWSNLITGIADDNADFGQLVNNFVESIVGKDGEGGVLNNILPRISTVLDGIVNLFLQLGDKLLPQVLDMGVKLISNLVTGISNNIGSLMNGVNKIINTIIPALIKMLPQIIDTGIQIILSLVEGIAKQLPTLIPQMVDTVILIVETLIDNIGLIVDAGIQLIIGLVQGLIDALPKLIDKIPEIIDSLVEAITNNLPAIIQAGVLLTIRLAEGIIKAIPQLVSKVPQIISSLIKGIANFYSNMLEVGKILLDKVKDGIASGVSKMAEVGLNLVKGLWNGINNAKDWLFNKIKGFKDAVLNKFKSFFGIQSPSKLFRDQIGENLALGIGEGFTDEMANVTKEMQDAMPTSFDTNVGLNSNTSNGINSNYSYNTMLNAFQEALASMKIELDDEVAGKFVKDTVATAIYG